MTKTTRAPRIAEIAADEGYNLSGAPVLLAKLTAYVSRPVFAQLATIATACNGEYSRHNTAFMFPIDATAARESFAQQARVILTNPATQPPTKREIDRHNAHRCHYINTEPPEAWARRLTNAPRTPAADAPDTWTVIPATTYTDAPTVETPPAIRVSTTRPIASTMTDRTPAGYGPTQPTLL